MSKQTQSVTIRANLDDFDTARKFSVRDSVSGGFANLARFARAVMDEVETDRPAAATVARIEAIVETYTG